MGLEWFIVLSLVVAYLLAGESILAYTREELERQASSRAHYRRAAVLLVVGWPWALRAVRKQRDGR